jgi:hypothetical protein
VISPGPKAASQRRILLGLRGTASRFTSQG